MPCSKILSKFSGAISLNAPFGPKFAFSAFSREVADPIAAPTDALIKAFETSSISFIVDAVIIEPDFKFASITFTLPTAPEVLFMYNATSPSRTVASSIKRWNVFIIVI